jgi:hypothetical protein
MRRSVRFLLVLILLGAAMPLRAQLSWEADTIPHDMLLANFGGLATDFIDLSYYHAFTHRDAVGLLAGMVYYPFGHNDLFGYAAAVAYRFYPGNRALWRFYVSPQLGYQYAAISPDTSAQGAMAGLLIGWQWFPEGPIAVGVGFGTRYIFGGRNSESAAIRKTFGFRPAIAFDLGYAW